ncbi:MAG: hypothetical protein ACLQO6_02825 [Desulfomonilaceae bacterium]
MTQNNNDLTVHEGLVALQTRLDSEVFRSPSQQALDSSLEQLSGLLGQILKGVDPQILKVENMSDFYKFCISLTGLKRAFSEDERVKRDLEALQQKVLTEYQDQIRQDLKDHPELVSKLRQVAENAAKTVANKPRAGRPKKHSKREK